MKNFKVLSLAIALIAVLGINSAFAGGNKSKKGLNTTPIQKQIVNMVQVTDRLQSVSLDGEALITFSIDENKTLSVKGVFGTNEDLIDHIQNSLEGATVKSTDDQIGKEYKLKLNFLDLR